MEIRNADPRRDAAACAAIYAPHVNGSPVSFEEAPPDGAEMAARIATIQATHPWLVAEDGEEVVGFAYGVQHRTRHAYRWSTDVSVYVGDGARRAGVGRALYVELLARLRDQGFQMAYAGIALPNEASVDLHESFGFEPVDVYHRVGWKAGAWRDVGWWQLRIGPPDADSTPPPEPMPPAEPAPRLP
ncbi:MAG: arsinothricin resistance N-acetyltransferase ArsN1 family B [Solirubrobacterales bacterium]